MQKMSFLEKIMNNVDFLSSPVVKQRQEVLDMEAQLKREMELPEHHTLKPVKDLFSKISSTVDAMNENEKKTGK